MNRHMKKMLQAAFEAPAPQRKAEFLKRFAVSGMSFFEFLASQVWYVGKRIWIFNLFMLVAAGVYAASVPEQALWFLCALTPVMAVAAVAESGRSRRFGMEEFEMSTRFSLRSVLFARFIITGTANAVGFAGLWLVAGLFGGEPHFQTGIYLLCPYFTTSYLCLCVSRKLRAQEAFYVCVAIAAAVSVLPVLLPRLAVFAANRFHVCTVLLMLSAIGVAGEYDKMIKLEELEWSL